MERLNEFIALAYQTADVYHNSWPKSGNGPQLRADGEPHLNHAHRVAAPFKGKSAVHEIAGVLHDTFEDTMLTPDRLRTIYYAQGFALTIGSEEFELLEEVIGLILEVTNVYTKQAYPQLTRKERHLREVMRLATISQKAAQIKASDIADNASSLPKHPDESFRRTYKLELTAKLHALTGGSLMAPLHVSDTYYRMASDAISRLY